VNRDENAPLWRSIGIQRSFRAEKEDKILIYMEVPIVEMVNLVGCIGAVKGAVRRNLGAVKGPGGAVILPKSSREGLAGPGNPGQYLK
jgi:hypothetical protein